MSYAQQVVLDKVLDATVDTHRAALVLSSAWNCDWCIA
jgi:hypothetical protein